MKYNNGLELTGHIPKKNEIEYRIYSNEIGMFSSKRWVEFGNRVKNITKKDVTFINLIEDRDGKLYPIDEFHKKNWKNMHKFLF